MIRIIAALLVLAGCATAVDEEIPVAVRKPDGPGPFPAVVILHDCSGLAAGSSGAPERWAAELVKRGYVVLLPDSFGPRGYPHGICTVPPSQRKVYVGHSVRARDAYAALNYARSLPYVNGRRVGLMGGSHGGAGTLSAMEPAQAPRRGGFAAAVALYPSCADHRGADHPAAPLLILIGEKDDWTPAAPCVALAERARRAGEPVSIKVYPGAYHSFDSPHAARYVAARINANAPGGRGATTGGNPAAWADSIVQVEGFFARHLKAE
ncbi:MAG: dienelactone hydrolase family protein [Burkholderiales bacterium]